MAAGNRRCGGCEQPRVVRAALRARREAEEGWDYGYLEALTTGIQNNNWVVQVLSPCDLTPGSTANEIVDDEGNYVYRFPAGDDDAVSAAGFTTSCLRGTTSTFTVVISNLPTGDIQVLDADYRFRLTGSSKP